MYVIKEMQDAILIKRDMPFACIIIKIHKITLFSEKIRFLLEAKFFYFIIKVPI